MYQKFKKSKSAEIRKKFLRAKHVVKHKIKVSHENYLKDILGLNRESDDTQNTGKSDFSQKRHLSLLKKSKLNSKGIALLKDRDSTAISNVDKANILNNFNQFFHPGLPWTLSSCVRVPCSVVSRVVKIRRLPAHSAAYSAIGTAYFFSSPEPSGSEGELIVYPYSGVRCRCRRRQQCLNIFSSETALPIKAKFNVEPPWEGGTKVYINGPGHMTKMAAMPIYGKNL